MLGRLQERTGTDESQMTKSKDRREKKKEKKNNKKNTVCWLCFPFVLRSIKENNGTVGKKKGDLVKRFMKKQKPKGKDSDNQGLY
jgi:hypothetical protein